MSYTDFIQSFQVEGEGNREDKVALRGRMTRLGPELNKAFERQNYPAMVSKLLGETVAVSLILASSLKYEGVFVLQTKGDGPISMLMADVTSEGSFRSYAIFDQEKLDAVLAKNEAPSLLQLLGAGYLAFSVDQGPDTERYQGITELTGASIADCAHQYFQKSEQLKTAMVVMAEASGQVAGALMIQQLPSDGTPAADAASEEVEEDWLRAVTLMSSVKANELLDDDLASEDLLYRLFHEDGVRVFDVEPVINKCRCSEDKVRQTLVAFSAEEVDSLYENDKISVVCEFCKIGYYYSREDMATLRAKA